MAVNCKIRLLKVIVFTEATVLKTTEAAASVASNVATALKIAVLRPVCVLRGIPLSPPTYSNIAFCAKR